MKKTNKFAIALVAFGLIMMSSCANDEDVMPTIEPQKDAIEQQHSDVDPEEDEGEGTRNG